MGPTGGLLFFWGGGQKYYVYFFDFYILNTICLNIFLNSFFEDFLVFVSPSFELTTHQRRLGVFEEVPSLNASTEHDEWMRKVGSIEVRELRSNGIIMGDCQVSGSLMMTNMSEQQAKRFMQKSFHKRSLLVFMP